MKLYLLNDRSGTTCFFDQKKLLKCLTDAINRGVDISTWSIESGEFAISEQSSAKNFLDHSVTQTQREVKLNTIIEGKDPITQFREIFIQLAPEDKSKTQLLNKINLISDPKDLAKLIKSNANYFLYNVSESVQWFSALLSVYNFRKVADEYVKEYPMSTGYSRWGLRKTSQQLKDNFLKAKSSK